MDDAVRRLFDRYQAFFARALAGDQDEEVAASLYTPEFIAASAQGVRAGRMDEEFRQAMAQGYARYRAIGTKAMQLRQVRVTRIDAHHAVAQVGWRATYARDDLPRTTIDFDVHYLVQVKDGEARVFGWITGDEDVVLRRHGVI